MAESGTEKGTLDLNFPAESMRNCELCDAEATVYCASDSAHLCWTCDAKVHNANFLVARHIRSIICSNCRHLDDFSLSAAGISPARRNLCRSCSPPEDVAVVSDDDSLSSSSSSCVLSTTEEDTKCRRKRRERMIGAVAVNLKVEGILVNWCRRMLLDDRKSLDVVATAVEVLRSCSTKMTSLPFIVSLATSFWVAIRACRLGDGRDLRRLEQLSGVPAKLILGTESRLARAMKRRQSRDNHEEGWAEC